MANPTEYYLVTWREGFSNRAALVPTKGGTNGAMMAVLKSSIVGCGINGMNAQLYMTLAAQVKEYDDIVAMDNAPDEEDENDG